MKRKAMTMTEIFNAQIVIPMLDPIIHTDEHPYCDDLSCPCNANVVDADQDETGTHAPDCRCSWCEPQERNATTQCADGSWW